MSSAASGKPPLPTGNRSVGTTLGLNSFNARYGAKANESFVPLVDEIVCFDLAAIQWENQRLLKIVGASRPVTGMLKSIEADQATAAAFRQELDQRWAAYRLRGAALVFDWREDLRAGMALRLNAIQRAPIYLKATDPLLVVNVLARARGALLLANAPLALERSFVDRVLASTDLRLIEYARAYGCVEASLISADADHHDDGA